MGFSGVATGGWAHTQVGGEDDHGVAEIHRLALAIRQPPFIQHLETQQNRNKFGGKHKTQKKEHTPQSQPTGKLTRAIKTIKHNNPNKNNCLMGHGAAVVLWLQTSRRCGWHQKKIMTQRGFYSEF